MFSDNIEHLTFKHTSRNSWDDEYELYDLEITTPSYVQENLLENKTLNILAKVNRIFSDITQEVGYVYGQKLSVNWSDYLEDSDEKHYVVYDLEDKFQNLHDFQKKYKTIKLDLNTSYDSNWPISGSAGKGSYLKYSTKNLSSESSVSWINMVDVSETWGSMKILVYVAYKVYFQENKVKVATKLRQKIKTDGAKTYYIELHMHFPKIIISTT